MEAFPRKEVKKVNIFQLLQLIGGLLITIANAPQIFHIITTKNVSGLSATTFVLLSLGTFLNIVYAGWLWSEGGGPFLFISLLTSFFMINTILVSIKYFQGKE